MLFNFIQFHSNLSKFIQVYSTKIIHTTIQRMVHTLKRMVYELIWISSRKSYTPPSNAWSTPWNAWSTTSFSILFNRVLTPASRDSTARCCRQQRRDHVHLELEKETNPWSSADPLRWGPIPPSSLSSSFPSSTRTLEQNHAAEIFTSEERDFVFNHVLINQTVHFLVCIAPFRDCSIDKSKRWTAFYHLCVPCRTDKSSFATAESGPMKRTETCDACHFLSNKRRTLFSFQTCLGVWWFFRVFKQLKIIRFSWRSWMCQTLMTGDFTALSSKRRTSQSKLFCWNHVSVTSYGMQLRRIISKNLP